MDWLSLCRSCSRVHLLQLKNSRSTKMREQGIALQTAVDDRLRHSYHVGRVIQIISKLRVQNSSKMTYFYRKAETSAIMEAGLSRKRPLMEEAEVLEGLGQATPPQGKRPRGRASRSPTI